MTQIANPLEQLIRRMARLPGLGPRSARRAVLHLIRNRETLMLPLSADLDNVAQSIKSCAECGNLDTADICRICRDSNRNRTVICIVEDVADLWALERASIFSGLYHVLGGVMNAIDGIGPETLRIPYLAQRVSAEGIKEVILATSATVNGQTTAHYIAEKLTPSEVAVTRLALGVPVGSELDYLDEGTLAQAMKARRNLKSEKP